MTVEIIAIGCDLKMEKKPTKRGGTTILASSLWSDHIKLRIQGFGSGKTKIEAGIGGIVEERSRAH